MIIPKLIELSTSDLEHGGLPQDPSLCRVAMVATIGPTLGEGGDNFSFEVITPRALVETDADCWGRGLLILDTFSWPAVERAVGRLLSHAARQSWEQVAQELNKTLHWEFDNYQPCKG